jgi:hypothetical protein
VVNLRPDLVLMDIEMPSAVVAIAAIISTRADVQIVDMFNALHAPGLNRYSRGTGAPESYDSLILGTSLLDCSVQGALRARCCKVAKTFAFSGILKNSYS